MLYPEHLILGNSQHLLLAGLLMPDFVFPYDKFSLRDLVVLTGNVASERLFSFVGIQGHI